MLQNLLNVHVQLSEHSRRYGIGVGFVGEEGHALVNVSG